MKHKFEGEVNKSRLIEALAEQRLIQGNRSVAETLAVAGIVVDLPAGSTIIEQHGTDDAVYFVLAGTVEVFVNHRSVGHRKAREHFGEMVAIDSTARRSATVKAVDTVTALKVSGDVLAGCLDAAPQLWKQIAKTLADRLREREKFLRPANAKPVIFVGSSVEGLSVARLLAKQFKHDSVVLRLWTENVFGPSGIAVDELLKQVELADYAVFVFGPDDQLASRNVHYHVPRDNVIFELGLFMGRLSRERVFILQQHGCELHIPSDLLGLTPLSYTVKGSAVQLEDLTPPCDDLRQRIAKLGAV